MWVLGAAAALGGCPGEIDRPERFDRNAPRCALSLDVEADVFVRRCAIGGCHSATDAAGRLDLASPGVAQRLIGVMTDPSGPCAGHALLRPEAPLESLFLDKLNATPACGTRMPASGQRLSADEVQCVAAWVYRATGAGDAGSRPDGESSLLDSRAPAPGADGGMDAGGGSP